MIRVYTGSKNILSTMDIGALSFSGRFLKILKILLYRGMEQLVARLAHNQEVVGSNPTLRNYLEYKSPNYNLEET